jgi:hypothetical protein
MSKTDTYRMAEERRAAMDRDMARSAANREVASASYRRIHDEFGRVPGGSDDICCCDCSCSCPSCCETLVTAMKPTKFKYTSDLELNHSSSMNEDREVKYSHCVEKIPSVRKKYNLDSAKEGEVMHEFYRYVKDLNNNDIGYSPRRQGELDAWYKYVQDNGQIPFSMKKAYWYNKICMPFVGHCQHPTDPHADCCFCGYELLGKACCSDDHPNSGCCCAME